MAVKKGRGDIVQKITKMTTELCNDVTPFKTDRILVAIHYLENIFPDYKWNYQYNGQDYVITAEKR